MDRSRFPEERAVLESEECQQQFPDLGSAFEVLGPAPPTYNCIAHSLGYGDRWINPQTGSASEPLALMDSRYQAHGWLRASTPTWDREPGKQKVVLDALRNADGSIREVTHAARQEDDGTWSSKLGQGALIRHATPDALRGPLYGDPVAVYVR
jgi:type VI secretion system secreted protein VgrG